VETDMPAGNQDLVQLHADVTNASQPLLCDFLCVTDQIESSNVNGSSVITPARIFGIPLPPSMT